MTLDGGEFRSLAGEFNKLRMIPEEQWEVMEKTIREANKKQKGGKPENGRVSFDRNATARNGGYSASIAQSPTVCTISSARKNVE